MQRPPVSINWLDAPLKGIRFRCGCEAGSECACGSQPQQTLPTAAGRRDSQDDLRRPGTSRQASGRPTLEAQRQAWLGVLDRWWPQNSASPPAFPWLGGVLSRTSAKAYINRLADQLPPLPRSASNEQVAAALAQLAGRAKMDRSEIVLVSNSGKDSPCTDPPPEDDDRVRCEASQGFTYPCETDCLRCDEMAEEACIDNGGVDSWVSGCTAGNTDRCTCFITCNDGEPKRQSLEHSTLDACGVSACDPECCTHSSANCE
jgi:hypothetical protein